MSRYTLTVRHGPDVERERFGSLDEAVAELERRAESIRAEGPLEKREMLREFEPSEQVAARLELSAPGGLLRKREAGLDVKGDGRLVAYRGAIFKHELEPGGGESPYEAIRSALTA